jgi:hypothetical protein
MNGLRISKGMGGSTNRKSHPKERKLQNVTNFGDKKYVW